MAGIYTKTRELTAGTAGTALSVYHLTSHQNIDSEIQDISAALTSINSELQTYVPWTSWTPVATGFSVGPSSVAKYMRIGNQVTLFYNDQTSPGTSNDTTFTITGLPVAARYALWFPLSLATSNSVRINTGVATIGAGGTTITCYTDHVTPGAWGGGNAKGAGSFTIVYEAQP